MKICILTSGHYALDDRIFYKEAVSLRKVYEDISLIGSYDKEFEEVEGIKVIGVKKANSLYDRYKLVDKIIDRAIEEKADVYHFHDFEIILKVLRLKKALPNCKIVYDVHEYYPDMITMSKKIPNMLKPFGKYYVNEKEESVVKKLDCIITTDDYNKERFSHINNNVEVIYNFSEFQVKDEPDTEKLYDVIYQGGISIERGAMMLVQAINIVKQKIPNVRHIFVGSFDDKITEEQVMGYVEKNGLQENVKYLGRKPHKDVENYLRKSKMGVVAFLPYPRHAKNIPIKQFEYMSCGIPVIGGNLPSVKRFITKYNSGLVVNPVDPQDIANAIIKVIEDPKLQYELGKNGITAVKQEYNWHNMEKKMWDIYKKLEK